MPWKSDIHPGVIDLAKVRWEKEKIRRKVRAIIYEEWRVIRIMKHFERERKRGQGYPNCNLFLLPVRVKNVNNVKFKYNAKNPERLDILALQGFVLFHQRNKNFSISTAIKILISPLQTDRKS